MPLNLSWLVAPGTVQASLLTGVLGLSAHPAVIEMIAWVLYAVPMIILVAGAKRSRPKRSLPTPTADAVKTEAVKTEAVKTEAVDAHVARDPSRAVDPTRSRT
jgi:high-affinity iron transporter